MVVANGMQVVFPELLNETPLGQEVFELLSTASSVERSIMLATSPTNLRVFLLNFFEQHNIEIERGLL